MGARSKLNLFYFEGALCCAAVLGGAARSWSLFFTMLLSLTLAQMALGQIRPNSR